MYSNGDHDHDRDLTTDHYLVSDFLFCIDHIIKNIVQSSAESVSSDSIRSFHTEESAKVSFPCSVLTITYCITSLRHASPRCFAASEEDKLV